MKVAIVADSPTLTTGFAVTTNRIARALTAADHEVVYFDLKAYGEILDRSEYPFRIWTIAIDFGSPWGNLLRRFLDYEKPEADRTWLVRQRRPNVQKSGSTHSAQKTP